MRRIMLPFTKRPGRDESGDVVTKDDLDEVQTSAVKRSVPPPAQSERPRKLMPSFSEDELTHLMPSKALSGSSVVPAAGRPASMPPAAGRPATVPPPARTGRAQKFVDDDHDEGRTVVRGAPKIMKRATVKSQPPPQMGGPQMGTLPTTISPAAVIKATLESARAPRRNDLMAGPPRELLEDHSDVHPADQGPQRTVQLAESPQAMAQASTMAFQSQQVSMASSQQVAMASQQVAMASQSVRSVPPPPASYPPPANSYPPPAAAFPISYPQLGPQSYAATVSSSSTSVPGMAMAASSMPPHFMVPQTPYSDGRMDPPGTSHTSRQRANGRPAISWAAALLAFGLFVGVGAVAVMQRGADGLAETTASFVDPSRAPGARAGAGAPLPQPAAEPATVAAPPVAVPAEPVTQPAAPMPPPPAADPNAQAAPVPAAPPPVAPGVIGASPVTPAPAPAPVATFKPPVRQWSPPSTPAAKPADEASSEPKKPAKKGGKGEDDAEMKKALEQLQKSQLEQSM
jgi:hypothetical protein